MNYSDRLKTLLASPDLRDLRRIIARLNSPQKIQDYLDMLPINFELKKETYMSPLRLVRERTAHCFEGALFASAAIAYHGGRPLLLDLRTIEDDEDHVVALFRAEGRWGAISKTNHPILRYRDPAYMTVRELTMSYFHEYLLDDGRKSLREYSKPFDLRRFAPERWVTTEEELFFLVDALDDSRHFPVAPRKVIRKLRKASALETKAINIVEWPEPRRSKEHLPHHGK